VRDVVLPGAVQWWRYSQERCQWERWS
jgi:hypothetical protein